MPHPPAVYRVRWFTPINAELAVGLSVDDVSIGGTEHPSGAKLKAWLTAQEWPVGTVFEVSRRAGPGTTVRCFSGQIAAWQPNERKLPLGSAIELPRSCRSQLQIFEAMLERAMDYALSRDLLDAETAIEIQQAVMQSVLKEAAQR